ncbi:LLM class flavin-dependent oxidoreductase [Halalkalibacter alkaliphilus]|uniref:LLM class flavin-dependent oxidoreductase n=1 Tax=Halalkalibacter alkaliphilus TaxID=2917993 RepID=A0A9X1ZZK1_9BACI|nr:LLM class flavin-dependent oxidoreductase [Halalkalibacter alkaliphilus]MCL7746527.1 LLM class flavin-dependent oxidoreductase [Halalkalibacter alkaliphilus]
MVRLSILDQSPIAAGVDARTAVMQTAELAVKAEQLGYHRFWVSEHHDAGRVAGSTPEVLLAHIGEKTKKIRIGSGGVMLPHYSSYKVAENFKMLEALYPNRIDLGLGRAAGGNPIATMALQGSSVGNRGSYPEQIEDLKGYFTSLSSDHRYYGITATPNVDTMPQLWLLGSSGGSAQIAAEKGTAFTFAHFINGDGGEDVVKAYRNQFQPSAFYEKPEANVAIHLICADTDEEANQRATSLDLSLLMLQKGKRSLEIPTIEYAKSYPYTAHDLMQIRENRKRMIVGGPDKVKEEIEELANKYETDEVMVITITHDYSHRIRSFELLAEMFNLVKS